MPQKRRFLRRELQKDMARPGVQYQLANFSFETEKKDIEDSIKSLTALVDDFDGTNKDIYGRARSRLTHLRGRIMRIPEDIGDEISGFRGDNLILVSTLEDELDEIMEKHTQGVTLQANTSTLNAPSTSKSFPVHKWNITFEGTDSKVSVNSFLEQIEELSFSRNVSEDELFRSAIELFEGPAKVWYRLIRKSVNSWNELVAALRRDFLSKDSDDDLWACIRSRKQKRDERVIIFVAAVENLFDCLTIKASRAEKLKIIRKNLLEEYHVHLALTEIETVEQLLEICRKLEDAGIIKADDQRSSVVRRKVFSLEPDLTHLPTSSQRSRNSSTAKSRSIAELRCFRCKQLGHIKRYCQTRSRPAENQTRKGPYCFGCGRVGVIKPNCPDCSKNS